MLSILSLFLFTLVSNSNACLGKSYDFVDDMTLYDKYYSINASHTDLINVINALKMIESDSGNVMPDWYKVDDKCTLVNWYEKMSFDCAHTCTFTEEDIEEKYDESHDKHNGTEMYTFKFFSQSTTQIDDNHNHTHKMSILLDTHGDIYTFYYHVVDIFASSIACNLFSLTKQIMKTDGRYVENEDLDIIVYNLMKAMIAKYGRRNCNTIYEPWSSSQKNELTFRMNFRDLPISDVIDSLLGSVNEFIKFDNIYGTTNICTQ
jgi:hypothetical protein